MIDHLRRLSLERGGEVIKLSSLSYNLIMTESYLHLVPRRGEIYLLTGEVGETEPLSINALGYAGMVLCKSQAAVDAVKRVGVVSILSSLAFSSVATEAVDIQHDSLA